MHGDLTALAVFVAGVGCLIGMASRRDLRWLVATACARAAQSLAGNPVPAGSCWACAVATLRARPAESPVGAGFELTAPAGGARRAVTVR